MPRPTEAGGARGPVRALALRFVFLLAILAFLDVLLSLTLCRFLHSREFPLPPYGLTFTPEQARALSLGNESWSYLQFDPDLGWSLEANGESRAGRYRANAAGFRANREYEPEVAAGVTRIAAFGDSYTHADKASNDEMWTDVLERSRQATEVLNFGVPGYGTDQAYLRYQRDGARYHPDVVLIGFMLENILRNVSVYRPAYDHGTGIPMVKPRFRLAADGRIELVPSPARSMEELRDLVDSHHLLDTIETTDFWVARAPMAYRPSPLFWSSIGRILYASFENYRSRKPYYEDPTSEPYRVTVGILEEFHTRALEDGAREALVLILPDRRVVHDAVDGREIYWATMVENLEAAGVPVVDLTPPFVEAARREGIAACFDGTHYNAKGNAIVADTIARAIFR